jgi:beta-phosphoglucomutase
MPHAVIFDIDGVLIDSYEPHYESWKMLAGELGQTVTPEQFAASFGRTSKDIIRIWWSGLFGADLTEAKIAELDERKEAAYRAVVSRTKPVMEGAVALIDALHAAGFKLAVGSSGPPANVDLSLKLLGREAKFSARVTGMDVTRGKPDPQVFLIAAGKLGVLPAECAVIEDAPAGIAAANAARMASIGLLGTTDALGLKAAKLIVPTLAALDPKAIVRLIEG